MQRSFFSRYRVIIGAGLLFICGAAAIAVAASIAPAQFPVGATVAIRKDMTLSEAADALQDAGIIRSSFIYKVYATLAGNGGRIVTGTYAFDEPQSALRVAYRTSRGIQGVSRVKVTIPEGSDVNDIAWIMLRNIPRFDAPAFVALAHGREGHLFPETYFFYDNVSPEDVIAAMDSVFAQKISTLSDELKKSDASLEEVLTMASIIEREAMTPEDRRIVAGILWKRLDAGMPLQVDAPFWYLFRRGTKDLTGDDLKIDSPYNTYVYKGLPPGPISNPGLEAIKDTLDYEKSSYWYYLSDSEGHMHYAATLDEHAANKRKYLK